MTTPDFTGVTLPHGGNTGDVLSKTSNDSFDVEWAPVSGGGGGSVITGAYVQPTDGPASSGGTIVINANNGSVFSREFLADGTRVNNALPDWLGYDGANHLGIIVAGYYLIHTQTAFSTTFPSDTTVISTQADGKTLYLPKNCVAPNLSSLDTFANVVVRPGTTPYVLQITNVFDGTDPGGITPDSVFFEVWKLA